MRLETIFTKFLFSVLILLGLSFVITGCTKKITKANGATGITDEKKNGTHPVDKKKNTQRAVKEKYIENKPEGSKNNKTAVSDAMKYTGFYKISVISFRGTLNLSYNKETGLFSGNIKFDGWGKGIPEPLKNLIIKNNKIYFIRSIKTSAEAVKYGSKSYFSQKYTGIFSSDGSRVKGEVVYSGSVSGWSGKR